MFPQVGPLFFRMAGSTGFNNRRFLKKEIVIAVMWIMAVTTSHIAESQRVTTGLKCIGTTFAVTLKAGFLLFK